MSQIPPILIPSPARDNSTRADGRFLAHRLHSTPAGFTLGCTHRTGEVGHARSQDSRAEWVE
jgi:hypothetical protein